MNIDTTLARYDREIGQRIRNRRKQLELTQTALGDAIGVSFQQIQKYERGVNRVSASALVLIAQVLRLPPSQLLDEVAAEVAAATPQSDLVRDLLDTCHGVAIAESVLELNTRDAALVAGFASRLAAGPVKTSGAQLAAVA